MRGLQVQDILGANIKRVRQQMGLTQAALAEKAGISSGYICDIERSRRWPSSDNIARLADVLKVDPYQLLLPNQDSPYFDRHRTLTAFKRQLEDVFEESITNVFDNMMRPYGPLRDGPPAPDGNNTDNQTN